MDAHDLNVAQITPSSFPSRPNTSSAWSICCAVCVAITLVRSRHRDGGSAGGTTGLVNTPDRKSTRLNSSHANISYAVFCLKKKKKNKIKKERKRIKMRQDTHKMSNSLHVSNTD